MKLLGFILSTVLLVAPPVFAAEYQGENVDGRKLSAKVYSYETGATYDAQVEFNQDQAYIRFPGGGEITVSLRQANIPDSGQVEAYGGPGQFSFGSFFTFGFGYARTTDNLMPPGPNPLRNFWRISLEPGNLGTSISHRASHDRTTPMAKD